MKKELADYLNKETDKLKKEQRQEHNPMNQDKATARPWHLDGMNIKSAAGHVTRLDCDYAGRTPCPNEVQQANASLIVRCVNSHEKLVKTLQDIQKTLQDDSMMKVFEHYRPHMVSAIKSALELAKGE